MNSLITILGVILIIVVVVMFFRRWRSKTTVPTVPTKHVCDCLKEVKIVDLPSQATVTTAPLPYKDDSGFRIFT